MKWNIALRTKHRNTHLKLNAHLMSISDTITFIKDLISKFDIMVCSGMEKVIASLCISFPLSSSHLFCNLKILVSVISSEQWSPLPNFSFPRPFAWAELPPPLAELKNSHFFFYFDKYYISYTLTTFEMRFCTNFSNHRLMNYIPSGYNKSNLIHCIATQQSPCHPRCFAEDWF